MPLPQRICNHRCCVGRLNDLGKVVLAAAQEPKVLIEPAVDGEVGHAPGAEMALAYHRGGVPSLLELGGQVAVWLLVGGRWWVWFGGKSVLRHWAFGGGVTRGVQQDIDSWFQEGWRWCRGR